MTGPNPPFGFSIMASMVLSAFSSLQTSIQGFGRAPRLFQASPGRRPPNSDPRRGTNLSTRKVSSHRRKRIPATMSSARDPPLERNPSALPPTIEPRNDSIEGCVTRPRPQADPCIGADQSQCGNETCAKAIKTIARAGNTSIRAAAYVPGPCRMQRLDRGANRDDLRRLGRPRSPSHDRSLSKERRGGG